MEAIIIIIATVILVCVAIFFANREVDHREILYGGRVFEVYCNAQGNYMCGVSIYEVKHPDRKIFRTKYRDTKYFFIDDYETIKEGIYAMLKDLEEDEQISNAHADKWKEFKNDC